MVQQQLDIGVGKKFAPTDTVIGDSESYQGFFVKQPFREMEMNEVCFTAGGQHQSFFSDGNDGIVSYEASCFSYELDARTDEEKKASSLKSLTNAALFGCVNNQLKSGTIFADDEPKSKANFGDGESYGGVYQENLLRVKYGFELGRMASATGIRGVIDPFGQDNPYRLKNIEDLSPEM